MRTPLLSNGDSSYRCSKTFIVVGLLALASLCLVFAFRNTKLTSAQAESRVGNDEEAVGTDCNKIKNFCGKYGTCESNGLCKCVPGSGFTGIRCNEEPCPGNIKIPDTEGLWTCGKYYALARLTGIANAHACFGRSICCCKTGYKYNAVGESCEECPEYRYAHHAPGNDEHILRTTDAMILKNDPEEQRKKNLQGLLDTAIQLLNIRTNEPMITDADDNDENPSLRVCFPPSPIGGQTMRVGREGSVEIQKHAITAPGTIVKDDWKVTDVYMGIPFFLPETSSLGDLAGNFAQDIVKPKGRQGIVWTVQRFLAHVVENKPHMISAAAIRIDGKLHSLVSTDMRPDSTFLKSWLFRISVNQWKEMDGVVAQAIGEDNVRGIGKQPEVYYVDFIELRFSRQDQESWDYFMKYQSQRNELFMYSYRFQLPPKKYNGLTKGKKKQTTFDLFPNFLTMNDILPPPLEEEEAINFQYTTMTETGVRSFWVAEYNPPKLGIHYAGTDRFAPASEEEMDMTPEFFDHLDFANTETLLKTIALREKRKRNFVPGNYAESMWLKCHSIEMAKMAIDQAVQDLEDHNMQVATEAKEAKEARNARFLKRVARDKRNLANWGRPWDPPPYIQKLIDIADARELQELRDEQKAQNARIEKTVDNFTGKLADVIEARRVDKALNLNKEQAPEPDAPVVRKPKQRTQGTKQRTQGTQQRTQGRKQPRNNF